MLKNKFVAFYTEDNVNFTALIVIKNGNRKKVDTATIEPTEFFGLNNFIKMYESNGFLFCGIISEMNPSLLTA